MNRTSQILWNERVRELFVFLEDSIVSMEQMLGKLNELRAAVIRRDPKLLEAMSDQMPEMSVLREGMQRRQQQISQSFADFLKCPARDVNLTRIVSFLDPVTADRLQDRQRLVKDLLGRLSREHRSTELLLRECERLNRMVLDSLIGKANQSCTYGSGGRVTRDMHCAIISMRM